MPLLHKKGDRSLANERVIVDESGDRSPSSSGHQYGRIGSPAAIVLKQRPRTA
jgi:hypothetical protein